MNREMEFIRKFSLAYAAACKPLCQELKLPQTAFDILMFLANNPAYQTAADIAEVRASSRTSFPSTWNALYVRVISGARALWATAARPACAAPHRPSRSPHAAGRCRRPFSHSCFPAWTRLRALHFLIPPRA